ncbi:hypothetical protein [Leptonema illini]|uniref:Lipoprotein n=1 Tax=Leptonema illini DSM 21528 TaxID=929563 RepID=H2CKX6_9LEPT|nr:hypothetical protein [Leptonema illini]EHQ06210.1 hypothetical protein Lepil_1522 [Leptonema illini DSM 21528]
MKPHSIFAILLLYSLCACVPRLSIIICQGYELTDSQCGQSIPLTVKPAASDYCQSIKAEIPSQETLRQYHEHRESYPGLDAALQGKIVWADNATSVTQEEVEAAGGVWEETGGDPNAQWHKHPTVGSFSAFDWSTGQAVLVKKTEAAYAICSPSTP